MADNPPAFPCEAKGGRSVPPEHDHIQTGVYSSKFPGMTLRDYFAGHALLAIGTWCPSPNYMLGTEQACRERASYAYAMADAMLFERKQVP